jgi:predicted Zn-dependent peptidase
MLDLKPSIGSLSNGLRVVHVQTSSAVAHFGVTVLAGSRFEEPTEIGLAHFLEHCIFKGTQKRKAFHILSRLDDVGGELNAYTAKEEMCIYASFSKQYLERTIDLISDLLLNSNFPEKEINKEKEIIIDEINSYLDNPSEKIFDDFEHELFKGHSLGNNILGSKESVRSFSKKSLQSYLSRFFNAQNMVISCVGDFSFNKLIRILEYYFGSVETGTKVFQNESPVNFNSFKIKSEESNYQVHAIMGGQAPSYKHEHRKGITLLTNLLGGPALNSRLTLVIREKYGYSYNIEANYNPYLDIGYWSIYFGTDSKYLDKTLGLIYRELRKMRTDKIGVLQLKRAKEQLKGQIALGMDNNSGLMQGLGKSLLFFDHIDSISDIYNGIDDLSASHLMEIANCYFDESQCSELIFTPAI